MRGDGIDDFEHLALIYEHEREYLAATRAFIEDGLDCGDSVLVSVPGRKLEAMRKSLKGNGQGVEFWNMNEVGCNPARIIAAVRDWVEHQESDRCRFIGEPIWPGRRPPEIVEATRHEALINMAFAGYSATILCPYDAAGLEDHVIADAERTHPELIRHGCQCASGDYTDPLELWRATEWPLPEPAERPAVLSGTRDLAAVRRFASVQLEKLGVSGLGLQDLVLAVDEAATNAIVHGSGAADLRIWAERSRVICEVADNGRLENVLAGKRRPELEWTSGRGVWLMNELCDLVELRPTDGGTVARLHLELDPVKCADPADGHVARSGPYAARKTATPRSA